MKMKPLTPREQECLDVIKAYYRENRVIPTHAYIAQELKKTSEKDDIKRGTATDYISKLIKKGALNEAKRFGLYLLLSEEEELAWKKSVAKEVKKQKKEQFLEKEKARKLKIKLAKKLKKEKLKERKKLKREKEKAKKLKALLAKKARIDAKMAKNKAK
jgi:hypothetical protein